MSTPTAALRLLAILLMASAPATAEEATPVAPGQLALWQSQDTERCAMAGRGEWPALDGACWFPVDLLAEEGTLTVSRWRGGQKESRRLRVAGYPYDVQHITLKSDKHVSLSKEDLARVRRDNSEIGPLWGLRTPRRFTLPLGPPLAELPSAGRFGSRRFFNGQPRNPHSGADYPAPEGMPVLATAAGTVALARDHFFAGKSVFIDHGDGLVSMYFHLSELWVKDGEVLERGQPIGAVGATGRATGPHLHFGLRWRGARVDPAALLGGAEAEQVTTLDR